MATSVGSAYVTLMPSMSGFASSISSDFSSAGTSAGSGFSTGFSAKAGAVAGVAASLANKAFTTVSTSLDSAISRVDTLNNFPTIMSNLGYSTDEASAALDKLVEGVDGLPTSLDSIVGSTQVLAPLCGSLDEAAELSLAFNNALLASGAGSEDASRAFQQYTQMLATGKVDQAAWNTLVEVMPGQLDQLAQALLGAEAGQADLYAAMQDGTVTFDDFNGAVMSLNEEGINGFASFEQQADDATAGIGTSIERMQLAVTRNLGEVIDKLNETGAVTGVLDGLREVVDLVGSAISDALGWLIDNQETVLMAVSAIGGAFVAWETAKGITSVIDQFGTLKEAADLAFEAIDGGQGVFETLSQAAGLLKDEDGGIVSVFKSLGSSIGDIGTKATKAGGGITGLSSALGLGPWGLVAAAIAAVVSALVWFFTQTETGKALMEQIWPYIQQVIEAAMGAIQAVIDFVWPYIQEIISIVSEGVRQIVETVWPVIQQVFENVGAAIQQVVDTVWPYIQQVFEAVLPILQELWEGAWGVIQRVFEAVWDVIVAVVETVMGVIQGIIDVVCGIISGDWEQVWNGIKTVFESVWNGIKGIVETVFGAVKDVISNVLDAIKGVWEKVWDGVSSFFSNIWEGIKQAASNAVDRVYDVVTGIRDKVKNFFSNAIDWLKDAGKNVVQGLWNGITGMGSWLWDKISGFFGSIVDGVLSLFGISSPSKVFAEIGGYTAEGLAVGVAGEADVPARSMAAVADAMLDAASGTLAAARDGLGARPATARPMAAGTSSDSAAEETLAEILQAVRAIYDKPTDVYMDSNKVSSALAARSRTVLAGRGLA